MCSLLHAQHDTSNLQTLLPHTIPSLNQEHLTFCGICQRQSMVYPYSHLPGKLMGQGHILVLVPPKWLHHSLIPPTPIAGKVLWGQGTTGLTGLSNYLQQHSHGHPYASQPGWMNVWICLWSHICILANMCHWHTHTHSHTVLYHPSPGWVSIAFGQDPSHSDDDITQYMWNDPLQYMVSSLSQITSVSVLLICFYCFCLS